MAETQRAFAGARAKIKFDGKEVGWATTCSGTMTVMSQEIETCGNFKPEEIEMLGMRFSVNFGRVYIDQTPLQSYGIWPDGELTLAQFIGWPGATIEIYDESADRPVVRMEGAKPNGTSTWRVEARGLASEDATYAATSGTMLRQ